MSETLQDAAKLAALVLAVEAAPEQTLGRTAIMKIIYFLQEFYGVDLGYGFSLYTYGPFDSRVLADLRIAVTASGLKETLISYPSGYGYEVTLGPDASKFKADAAAWIVSNGHLVHKAVSEFGSDTAANLELLSTAWFVAKEFGAKQSEADLGAIVDRVALIKPKYSKETIAMQARRLTEKGLLASPTPIAPAGSK